MWPFKKKRSTNDTLVMVRYTEATWLQLFPNSVKMEWELANVPSDVAGFVKTSVSNSVIGSAPIQKGLIATIDEQYLHWLRTMGYEHSTTGLSEYLQSHIQDTDYWTDRLISSGMLSTYNVLGIPSLIMLHDIRGSKSEMCISKETSQHIAELLSDIYGEKTVFVPGWITKGQDMPTYADDIIQLAELFWKEGKRARFGKCLEQNYNRVELADKFTPLYFVVPFVIKAQIDNAIINFSTRGFVESDKTCQAMAAKLFTEAQRVELFNLISNDVPQVVSIGPKSIMPSQAYINYAASVLRSQNRANIARY